MLLSQSLVEGFGVSKCALAFKCNSSSAGATAAADLEIMYIVASVLMCQSKHCPLGLRVAQFKLGQHAVSLHVLYNPRRLCLSVPDAFPVIFSFISPAAHLYSNSTSIPVQAALYSAGWVQHHCTVLVLPLLCKSWLLLVDSCSAKYTLAVLS